MNKRMEVRVGFENEGAAAEPSSTGASSGAAPTPQPGAGAPTPASPSGASSGASAQPQTRTYTTEEMSKAVQSRLAEERGRWEKQYGSPDELKSRLEKAERYEKALRGDEPKGPTPEEKELRELLTKQFPGIDKVRDIEAKLQAIENANQASHAKAGRDIIGKMATEKLGTSDPKVMKMLENVISASIAEDPESLKAWNSGDVSVIAKHFDDVLNSSFDPMFKSASARYSAGKAKDQAEVPPKMPQGGIQAPTSTDRKMSGDERRDAAWKRMQESAGQA